jgi:hypothetical protein
MLKICFTLSFSLLLTVSSIFNSFGKSVFNSWVVTINKVVFTKLNNQGGLSYILRIKPTQTKGVNKDSSYLPTARAPSTAILLVLAWLDMLVNYIY